MTGDEKVRALLSARLSHEAFALLIRENDPYILIDGEVLALTESEFYALHNDFGTLTISEEDFKRVVGMEDLSFMQPSDAAEVAAIREALPKCSACRYRKFKDAIRRLMKKYGLQCDSAADSRRALPEYPSCSSPVKSLVHGHVDDLYGISYEKRKACIDCVEKHTAQAYVLAGEACTGYPEYAKLIFAHLSEAVAELPEEFRHLRELLEFCMARTAATGKPFIPLGAIANLLKMYRESHSSSPDTETPNTENPYMELEITDAIREEVGIIRLSDAVCDDLRRHLSAADGICRAANASDEASRLSWEGEMACASECIAQVAPSLAGMLRNRRLVFVADPWLADQAGMSNADILALL